jgi:hypothetical protein
MPRPSATKAVAAATVVGAAFLFALAFYRIDTSLRIDFPISWDAWQEAINPPAQRELARLSERDNDLPGRRGGAPPGSDLDEPGQAEQQEPADLHRSVSGSDSSVHASAAVTAVPLPAAEAPSEDRPYAPAGFFACTCIAAPAFRDLLPAPARARC